MRRKYVTALAAALVLFLAGCGPREVAVPAPSPSATPEPRHFCEPELTEMWGFPIDDTHDAFEVSTWGKLGTVLVTVEIENEAAEELHFSVWTEDNLTSPFQTMEAAKGNAFCNGSFVTDANFDGYHDFGYVYARDDGTSYLHYWMWDEEKGQFVPEPTLDEIPWPFFDKETETIYNQVRTSMWSRISSFYRWEDGKPICVREIEWCYPDWGKGQDLAVRDRVDGELVEVYRKTFAPPEEEDMSINVEAGKWQDLNYHGEEK